VPLPPTVRPSGDPVAAKAAPTGGAPDLRLELGPGFCGRGLLTPTAAWIEAVAPHPALRATLSR